MKPEQRDAVTVGQIRRRHEKLLDDQIDTLGKLIRQGYFKLPDAEVFLKEAIAKTLTTIQNIDQMASTEILFPDRKEG